MALSCTGTSCVGRTGHASIRTSVTTMLHRQQAAWNRGDVDEFMMCYWKSPDLTFSSGGTITRGWRATLEGYRNRYPDHKAMGYLTFSELEVTEIGPDWALVLGLWYLEREEPVGGAFSLIFRKMRGRWVIVHDHTSRDADNGKLRQSEP